MPPLASAVEPARHALAERAHAELAAESEAVREARELRAAVEHGEPELIASRSVNSWPYAAGGSNLACMKLRLAAWLLLLVTTPGCLATAGLLGMARGAAESAHADSA